LAINVGATAVASAEYCDSSMILCERPKSAEIAPKVRPTPSAASCAPRPCAAI